MFELYTKEIDRDSRIKGQKSALLANTLYPVGNQIVMGALMMLYAGDVLSLPAEKIADTLTTLSLIGLIRFILLPFLTRVGKRKIMTVTSLLHFIIVIIMILFPEELFSYRVFLLLLILYSFCVDLGAGTAWQPLLRDITTDEDRGRFFARMRTVFMTFNLLVTGVTPFVIGDKISSLEYKIFLVIPLFAQLIMINFVRKVPEIKQTPISFLSPLKLYKMVKSFFTPLVMIVLVQCSFSPLFIVYLRQVVGLGSDVVSIAIFASSIGYVISLLIWGYLTDKLGFRNSMKGVTILSFFQLPFLLLISPDHVKPFILIVVGLFMFSFLEGAVLAGTNISLTSIQHYFSNREKGMFIFSIYSATILLVNSFWIYINGQVIEKLDMYETRYFIGGMLIVMKIAILLHCKNLPKTRGEMGFRKLLKMKKSS